MSVFLPYDKMSIKVGSTPDKIQRRLQDYIEYQPLEVIDTNDSYFLATYKPFKGIVDEYGFHVVPTVHSQYDPIKGLAKLVEARGKFYRDGEETIVRIALTPNPITTLSLLTIWVLLNFSFGTPSMLGLIIATIIMSIPYIALIIIFKTHAPSVKSRLLEVLKC